MDEFEIVEIESKLGVKFPDDYRKFISKFGSTGVGSLGIYGKGESEFGPSGNVLEETMDFIESEMFGDKFKELIVVSSDGFGNPIGFLKGRREIISPDHDTGKVHLIANTFEEF